MLNKQSAINTILKTILLTAVLLAGTQLYPKAYAQIVPNNPLAAVIGPFAQPFCPVTGGGDIDRNLCSAVPDSENTALGPYLYQRVEWEDVSTRDMTAAEEAIYVTAADQQTLDPAVKNLQKQLGDDTLIPHSALTKQKSSKDRIIMLGIYDRINGALRIVAHRIIYGQLATYDAANVLEVSDFQVHTQRTTIGPKHFDYLQATNAWLDPSDNLNDENSGINPFNRFWEDNDSKVFYNINFGAAIVALSKARGLVDADVAYMMVVNYTGTQDDLNINNPGQALEADAGFQGGRTEIEMYYEWYRLFNHEKELGNLLGQSFSAAFCIDQPGIPGDALNPLVPCPDYQIVSSDDSLVYLDYLNSATGLSDPHEFPAISSADAETITPKTPIHQVIGNYLFANQEDLEEGFDFNTGGSPFSADDLFLKNELNLSDDDIDAINASFGIDTGYLINSRWLTYDFVANTWDQRAATRADFQNHLGGQVDMNDGHAYRAAGDYDSLSAGNVGNPDFAAIGEDIYQLFIEPDDLINSDVAALECFATADDPINPTNEEWYEKGCGQVGNSDNFLDSTTASQNVTRYQTRSQNIRTTLDQEREDAGNRTKANLPAQATMTPAEAFLQLRANNVIVINLSGGGRINKNGAVITATIGGNTFVINERQALKLLHRFPL